MGSSFYSILSNIINLVHPYSFTPREQRTTQTLGLVDLSIIRSCRFIKLYKKSDHSMFFLDQILINSH